MKESQALVKDQEDLSGKQQASLSCWRVTPREARCGRGSRDGLRGPAVALGQAQPAGEMG